jgi:site-specific DNA-methyltransferase (adenine-specific)
MITNTIHLSDCVKGMSALPKGSVDVVVTSPPYNLGIKYSTYKDNKPRQDYLAWMNEVFVAVKHCLKDDGHFFLNMGYSNIDPWVGMDVAQVARNNFVLQNHINWVKSIHVNDKTSGHFKPINSQRYMCPTWEHLFHFTKDGNVNIDRLSVGVEYEYYEANIRSKKATKLRKLIKESNWVLSLTETIIDEQNVSKIKNELKLEEENLAKKDKPNLRDKGNCWYIPYETINSKELKGKHPAIFPVKLVEECIKVSGIKSGIVLDPFMGTGTTAIAALNQGCEYLGFDVDNDYIAFANRRINDND